MFSDLSETDSHHPPGKRPIMPRENLSGDSRTWLLRNLPVGGTEETTPDKVDGRYFLNIA